VKAGPGARATIRAGAARDRFGNFTGRMTFRAG